MKNTTINFIENGNKLISELHIFCAGEGCYFPTKESAENNFNTFNKVGVHFKSVVFNDSTWYKMQATNAWN